LKDENRLLYGRIELAVACGVAMLALWHSKDEIQPYETVGICSALYLFVRAFDYINEAKKKPAADTTLVWLGRRLQKVFSTQHVSPAKIGRTSGIRQSSTPSIKSR